MKASDNLFPHLKFSEIATPANPAAANHIVYFKADGLLYSLDSGGTETAIGSGGGGGGGGGSGITAINEQTGTTYTLVLTDATACVRCTNAAAITLTLPPNSAAAIPVKSMIMILQGGAGAITVAAGAGVTVESPNGAVTTAAGDFRVLFKRDTDTWVIG